MNYKILFLALLVAGSTLIGCQDRLEEEFKHPERYNPAPEEIIPGLFTEMLWKRFFMLDYGEWWWSFGSGYGVPLAMSQIAVRRPHPAEDNFWAANRIAILDGTGFLGNNIEPSQRLARFFVDLRSYAAIRDEVEVLKGSDLDNNEIYLLTATVLKNTVALHMVDMFNRIPYSEAFQGTKGIFFPKYDDAKEVYVSALDELADIAARFQQVYDKMSAKGKDIFAHQDIGLGGDPVKWVQFTNSVRLRHAIRISGVDEAYAKTHIAAVVNNLPTTDFIFPNPRRNPMEPGRDNGAGIYVRALYEQAPMTLIPNIIMQRMNYGDIDYVPGEDDPRLPVIATPTRYSATNWQFTGVSMDYDSQYPYWPNTVTGSPAIPNMPNTSPAVGLDAGPGYTIRTFENQPINVRTHWLRNCYSLYNISTFTFGEIPCYLNSIAENDLFLAEAVLKGFASTGKTAGDHVKDAVINSTHYWYRINGLSRFWTGQFNSDPVYKNAFAPDKPSDALIEQFANKIRDEFNAADDKMEIIMQQKYIHHNIINPYELWAELRRTRRPKLEQIKCLSIYYKPEVERMRYHNAELQTNRENFMEVLDEDTYTTPIFWVPASMRNESFYRPVGDYLPLKGFEVLPTPNPNRPYRDDEGVWKISSPHYGGEWRWVAMPPATDPNTWRFFDANGNDITTSFVLTP